MTIVGCRIDGRLIHGQVANLWAGKLNVSRIMVVDDEVVNNDVEKSGLKLATPPGVKLSILPIEKAAANILAGKYDSQRLFIVARRPDRFLGLVEAGVPIETLNVGNNVSNTRNSCYHTFYQRGRQGCGRFPQTSRKRCETHCSNGSK